MTVLELHGDDYKFFFSTILKEQSLSFADLILWVKGTYVSQELGSGACKVKI